MGLLAMLVPELKVEVSLPRLLVRILRSQFFVALHDAIQSLGLYAMAGEEKPSG